MLSLISRFNGLNLNYHRAITIHRIATSPQSRKITLEEKLGIRPKPKRPMSPFLKFCSTIVKPSILKDSPTTPVTQITKIASERWKTADDNLKKKLSEEYQEAMVGYRASMKEYIRELSFVDKKLIDKFDPKLKKEKVALKKKRFELGCPKRPTSAYLAYLQTKRSDQGNMPYKDWVSKMSEVWRNLDASEKSKYVQQYELDKAEFIKKMTEWEKKMKESGNAHLLNTGTEKTNVSCRSNGRQGPIESEPEAHVSTKTTKT